MKVKVFENFKEASAKAAKKIAGLIEDAIDDKGYCTLGLSGGNSPALCYEKLSEMDVEWNKVYIFFVDERYISKDDEKSNYKMIKDHLLSNIKIPEQNVFEVPVDAADVKTAAKEYEERIKAFFVTKSFKPAEDEFPVFDILTMGIGPDGHTASIFPRSSVIYEADRYIMQADAPPEFDVKERITMTYMLINNADARIFIMSAEGREELLKGVLDGNREYPAVLVNRDSVLYTDKNVT
jgi:6-phosphogluconolactonase